MASKLNKGPVSDQKKLIAELTNTITSLRNEVNFSYSKRTALEREAAAGRSELTRLNKTITNAEGVIGDIMATNKVLTALVAEYQAREAERRQAMKAGVPNS